MEFELNNDLTTLTMDAEECYLRRLSLYATVRPEDLKSLKAGRAKELKKSKNGIQSLQDLFTITAGTKPFVPDLQTPLVEETDEQTRSSTESLQESRDVVVHGNDVQDLPIEYSVEGLRSHELPVIGKLLFLIV